MATRRSFNLDLDVRQVENLAERLDRLTVEQFSEVSRGTVNEVIERSDRVVRRRMLAGINLSEAYVDQRLTVEFATANQPKPTASIRAPARDTLLYHFGARVLTQPVRNAARSKGDPSNNRNIPAGQKSAGVSVEVTRGGRKALPGAFVMRLRNNANYGVFIREGERTRNLYGPGVYQLFRKNVEDIYEDIERDMVETTLTKIEARINEVLE